MDSVLAWIILAFLVFHGVIKLTKRIIKEAEARKYYNEEDSYNW